MQFWLAPWKQPYHAAQEVCLATEALLGSTCCCTEVLRLLRVVVLMLHNLHLKLL
jgi:hypothetical protein